MLFLFIFFIIQDLVSFICGPACCEVLGGAGSLLAPSSELGVDAVHPGWDQSPALPGLLSGSPSASQGRALMFNGELSVSAC